MVNAQRCQELFQFFDGQAASADGMINPPTRREHFLVAAVWVGKDMPCL